MTDPLNDPTFREDVIHTGQPALRPNSTPESRKQEQAESYQRRIDRECAELAAVLSTDAGQAVIMRILCQCHIYHEGKMEDYGQGQRSVGIRIIKDICAVSPEGYPKMLLKHAARQQALKDAENHNP